MVGLVPTIHVFPPDRAQLSKRSHPVITSQDVDARHKGEHDGRAQRLIPTG
jgi:hypothetical protein